MRPIVSGIDTESERFTANVDHNIGEVNTLRERQQWAVDGDRARSIERHLSRGKIMVRDRIDMVIDEGTAFMELSPLAGYGQYDPVSGNRSRRGRQNNRRIEIILMPNINELPKFPTTKKKPAA